MAFLVEDSEEMPERPDEAPFDVTLFGGSFDAMTPTIQREAKPEDET